MQSTRSQKTISISRTFAESWELVSGFKLPIFYISLMLTAIWTASFAIQLFLFFTFSASPLVIFLVCKLPSMIIVWYVLAVFILLGVRRAIGLPTQINLAFADCMRVKEKLFGLLLVNMGIAFLYMGLLYSLKSVQSTAPFLFLLISIALFLIYFFCGLIIYVFALPLVVTKRCTVQAALISAWETMKRHGLPVMVLFIVISVIMVLSMLPLGIGLIWTLPMYAALFGILFRDAYGLSANKKN